MVLPERVEATDEEEAIFGSLLVRRAGTMSAARTVTM
jgi:hypothetical protein